MTTSKRLMMAAAGRGESKAFDVENLRQMGFDNWISTYAAAGIGGGIWSPDGQFLSYAINNTAAIRFGAIDITTYPPFYLTSTTKAGGVAVKTTSHHCGVSITDLAYNGDGTVVYFMNINDIYAGALDVPYDIDGSSTWTSSSVFSGTFMYGFCFGDDGAKMYIVFPNEDLIREYDCSTPYDPSTAVDTSSDWSITLVDSRNVQIRFDPTGKYAYVNQDSNFLRVWDVPTAWDISTIVGTGTLISQLATEHETFILHPEGLGMISGTTGGIWQYGWYPAWTGWTSWVSATSHLGYISTQPAVGVPSALYMKPDGTRIYYADNGEVIDEYALTTAYDITNITHTGNSTSLTPSQIHYIQFSNDGSYFFTAYNSNAILYRHTVSTPWSAATIATGAAQFHTFTEDASMDGFWFSDNGENLVTVGSTNDKFYQYTLSTGYDLSTISYVRQFSIPNSRVDPYKLQMSSNGLRAIVTFGTGVTVSWVTYDFGTAWDVSTITEDAETFFPQVSYLSPGSTNNSAMAWDSAGRFAYSAETSTTTQASTLTEAEDP